MYTIASVLQYLNTYYKKMKMNLEHFMTIGPAPAKLAKSEKLGNYWSVH